MRQNFSNAGNDGGLYHLYETDPLAVIQYNDTMKRSVHLEPEKRLMLAVLDDALKCFQNSASAADNRSKKLFKETEEWFWLKDREGIFAFEHICTVLGLGPDYIRRKLVEWKSKATAGADSRPRLPARRKKRASGCATRLEAIPRPRKEKKMLARFLMLFKIIALAALFGYQGVSHAQQVLSRSDAVGIVEIENLRIDGDAISGDIVNRSPHAVRDIQLLVRHSWQWRNEFRPGADNPGRAI